MNKVQTIGWQAELLIRQILLRNQANTVVHNSLPDADDPTVGISGWGNDLGQTLRIPKPDFDIYQRGGTLFSGNASPRTYAIECKAKRNFACMRNWDYCVTTGMTNWYLEAYQRWAEECGIELYIWFIHIFPKVQIEDAIDPTIEAPPPGIYAAPITALYTSRRRWMAKGVIMAYWPVEEGPLHLLFRFIDLLDSEDTKGLVLKLQELGETKP